jgi:hypothetical protein
MNVKEYDPLVSETEQPENYEEITTPTNRRGGRLHRARENAQTMPPA